MPKLNILLICADQWQGAALSAVGHPNVRTPNLDVLARDGVLFTRHFGQATPCGPSRVSLLTGMYLMNHRSGRNGTPLDARHTNLALEARKAGYEPALFGYTDTAPDPRGRHPEDPALTAYDEGVMPGFVTPLHLTESFRPFISELMSKGYDYVTDARDVFRPKAGITPPEGRGFRFIPTEFSAEDSDTAFVTDAFLKWLLVRTDEPWFAHLVYLRPHPPLIAPEPYNRLVDPAEVALPARAGSVEEEARRHPFLGYALDKMYRPGRADPGNPLDLIEAPELEIRQMRATYYGLIAEVDHHIGRIVEHLKATGQYERTLIVFTSDHGEMLGEHYLWGKEIWFDPAFHLPLVIRDPRPEAEAGRGRYVDALTEAIDVMPTILDLVGIDRPRSCDGRSLAPFLAGTEPAAWRDAVFFEHDFRDVRGQAPERQFGIDSDRCCYAVLRGERYKYVHFAALPPLLFDLEADPHETRNLAGDPGYGEVMLDCARRMLDWRLAYAERTLTNMSVGEGGLFVRR